MLICIYICSSIDSDVGRPSKYGGCIRTYPGTGDPLGRSPRNPLIPSVEKVGSAEGASSRTRRDPNGMLGGLSRLEQFSSNHRRDPSTGGKGRRARSRDGSYLRKLRSPRFRCELRIHDPLATLSGLVGIFAESLSPSPHRPSIRGCRRRKARRITGIIRLLDGELVRGERVW
jgi:hypothetical protein